MNVPFLPWSSKKKCCSFVVNTVGIQHKSCANTRHKGMLKFYSINKAYEVSKMTYALKTGTPAADILDTPGIKNKMLSTLQPDDLVAATEPGMEEGIFLCKILYN